MKTIITYILPFFLFFVSCNDEVVEPEKTYTLEKEELNIAYGNDPRQKMDIYFPEGYSNQIPVVFLLHGGGFIAASKEGFTSVAKLFVAKGFAVVNLGYRLVDAVDLDQNPPLH